MRRPASILALGLALALAALAGCGSSTPPAAQQADQAAKPAPPVAPADNCTTADDCELVDTCCGCMTGGKRIAIRKDAIEAFVASRPQRCGDEMCPQFVSHDPSCDAEAICGSANRCRVAPHMQHQ